MLCSFAMGRSRTPGACSDGVYRECWCTVRGAAKDVTCLGQRIVHIGFFRVLPYCEYVSGQSVAESRQTAIARSCNRRR